MNTDFDPGTDHMGVPLRYSAEWHYGGCLPDTDVLYWSTPREAWNDLLERLESWEGMYEPDDEDDPMGPSHRSAFALSMERMAESDEPGQLTDSSGMIYSVEDTHVMTCGEPACGLTFPDIYPAGRCPYEANHAMYRQLEAAIAAHFVFSRTAGAR